MPSLWSYGIDYQNQPLIDAWWTPGWTAQNDSYIQVPESGVDNPGFPVNLNYVTILGSYFDTSGNPLSGYLTFWPSSPLLFTVDEANTYIPQRYAGLNFSLLGVNQMGDGKIYLQYGRLVVSVLATDNANMQPANFTYHVEEHYEGGLQYDITAPSSDDSSPQDIRNLIIPGSVKPMTDDSCFSSQPTITIPSVSSQYLVSDVTVNLPTGMLNPTSYQVNFAFILGSSLPQDSDWITGAWTTDTAPYLAQLLIGANGHVLSTGTYRVWLQILASPQAPVFSTGYVNIY